MKNPHVNSDDAGALDGVNDAKLAVQELLI